MMMMMMMHIWVGCKPPIPDNVFMLQLLQEADFSQSRTWHTLKHTAPSCISTVQSTHPTAAMGGYYQNIPRRHRPIGPFSEPRFRGFLCFWPWKLSRRFLHSTLKHSYEWHSDGAEGKTLASHLASINIVNGGKQILSLTNTDVSHHYTHDLMWGWLQSTCVT